MLLSGYHLASLCALLGQGVVVAGIQFSGPRATPVVRELDGRGWTPKPTSAPRLMGELRKRQFDFEDWGLCGYKDGDPESAVSCTSSGLCLLAPAFSWFGCCTDTSVTDCFVQTGCVPRASLSACLNDPACFGDPLITACTAASAPYCAYMYQFVDGGSYGHFECANVQTTFEVEVVGDSVLTFAPDAEPTAPPISFTERFPTDEEEASRQRSRWRTEFAPSSSSSSSSSSESEGEEPTSTEEEERPTASETGTGGAGTGSESPSQTGEQGPPESESGSEGAGLRLWTWSAAVGTVLGYVFFW